MIEHTYFRARIMLGCSIVGYASEHNPGTYVTTETKGRHRHWTNAQDAAELYCKGCDDTITYVVERVTIDVERMMEGPNR